MYNLDRYEGGIFEEISVDEEVDGYDLQNIYYELYARLFNLSSIINKFPEISNSCSTDFN